MKDILRDLFTKRVHWDREDAYTCDDFDGAATGSGWSKVVGGFLVPAAAMLYGAQCVLSKSAVLLGRHNTNLPLNGTNAVLMGCACIAAGAFLHFHYFWTVSEKLFGWAPLLKVLSLLAAVAAFVGMLVRVFRYGGAA